MIDTIHAVQTPEGVDLALPVAGPAPRGLAYALDLGIQAVVLSSAQTLLFSAGQTGFAIGLYLIAGFLVTWFYPVLFEVLARGQTPGKRIVGVRVVHENGTPIGWSASVLRNFLLVADFLPLLYLAGVVSICVDPSFRRLGDLAAGTLVVHAPRERRGLRRGAAARGAERPLPPALPLTLEEQRAVIAFAERAPLLSAERADEIAAIPAVLTQGGEPRARLVAIASWLLGRSA
ncbi:MAG TPA: RDD family protein [Myxococcota bacterium]|nr:RDD family protein [Myxococcota bacterium]